MRQSLKRLENLISKSINADVPMPHKIEVTLVFACLHLIYYLMNVNIIQTQESEYFWRVNVGRHKKVKNQIEVDKIARRIYS